MTVRRIQGPPPVWLLDFDGVINALSRRGGTSIWTDWDSATVDHPGRALGLPLLWSGVVIDTVAAAVAAGVDVRWLSTWREDTAVLPSVIPGLPVLGWLDEGLLGLPRLMDDTAWKVEVAKVFVADEVPLLWTDDSVGVEINSVGWRGNRSGPTVFIRPRPATGLVRREIAAIRSWIAQHTEQR